LPSALAIFASILFCFTPTAQAAFALDSSCQLPKANGGPGDCSPVCASVIKTTKSGCNFTLATTKTIDYAATIARLPSRVCTQSPDARCTSEALTKLVGKFAAVKAAYCNDRYLVVHTSQETTFGPYLDDISTPPGATDTYIGSCVTRMMSRTPSYQIYKIPLNPLELPTATNTNNIPAGFDFAGDDSTMAGATLTANPIRKANVKAESVAGTGYLLRSDGVAYGLNARGPVGVAVTGQEIFPIYNNRATHTLQVG
jgi:hypothetical protein